jgi:hypothetical protein
MLPLRHAQAFATPEPLHTLHVYLLSVATQLSRSHAVACAWMLRSIASELACQRSILVRLAAGVTLGGAWLADGLTGPALRHLELAFQVSDRFTFARRAYHFPTVISLSIALSKACSATNFLSLPFSFSSSLSRLTVF